jgi:hypothetical protein
LDIIHIKLLAESALKMIIYQAQTNCEFGALAKIEREVCGTYCNIGSNPLAPYFNK